ncbi:MAG TPA: transporter [Candidatus Acidoferrales bacterium]|nr:transporter [Candidatus Acidoferrales bacterium]
MRLIPRLLLTIVALQALPVCAQDLTPRAYVITPVGSNAVTLTWSYFNGGVNFNGSVPITGATGTYNVSSFAYYHSFSFFGRSANVTASLPYGVGTFQGELNQQYRSIYRSGLFDFVGRFSVNLLGGPAMSAEKFAKWQQKVLLGLSVKVIAPTGQYNPEKLVNWSIHRWAVKPEFGYSQRWGNWLVDTYAGVWFYTTNSSSYDLPVPRPQTEQPIGSLEGHLSRNFSFGTWVSLDANFWWGGVTNLGGITNLATRQTASRIGATAAWRYSRHQQLKASYSDGTYVRFGGNYQQVQVAWQYSWIGWSLPK